MNSKSSVNEIEKNDVALVLARFNIISFEINFPVKLSESQKDQRTSERK